MYIYLRYIYRIGKIKDEAGSNIASIVQTKDHASFGFEKKGEVTKL